MCALSYTGTIDGRVSGKKETTLSAESITPDIGKRFGVQGGQERLKISLEVSDPR